MSQAVANGDWEAEFVDRWAPSGEKYVQRALEDKLASALERERVLRQQLDAHTKYSQQVLKDAGVQKAFRADNELASAQERERALRQQLEAHKQADKTMQTKLDLNLCTLDQKVSHMKGALLERDLAIQRSDRMIAQLDQQRKTLQTQLENANKKLDDCAEVERVLRQKLKQALEQVKNVDKDKDVIRATLELSAQKERDALISERKMVEEHLRKTAEDLREKQRLEEERDALIIEKKMLEDHLRKTTEGLQEKQKLEDDPQTLQGRLFNASCELRNAKQDIMAQETAASILRNEVVQQQEQLKQNAELIEALKGQVEEANKKVKNVLDNPSSALSPPISREHQPPLKILESPFSLAGRAENSLSPVFSNLDKSVSVRIVEREQPGVTGGGLGGEGVKNVFKTLLMLDEEEEGGGMILVPRSVIENYRSQMAELEDGLLSVQSLYVRKELHETELAACQNLWAGKFHRFKQASQVQVASLRHEISQFEAKMLQAEVESRLKLQQLAETGHQDSQDFQRAVSEINRETSLMEGEIERERGRERERAREIEREGEKQVIAGMLADLNETYRELERFNRELERCRDYDALQKENSDLKKFLAETATSVKGAVEFRAKTMRQLMVENEVLDLRIGSLEMELEGAHCKTREIEEDGNQQLEAAVTALGQAEERVTYLEQATLNLEGLLALSRQGEKDCQAELEAIKESMQVEKLKAMAAELQNVGLRKDVELPTVRLEEAEQQVALLKEEMRLMEENHMEELKRYAQLMEESQEQERLYRLALQKIETSKTAEEQSRKQQTASARNAADVAALVAEIRYFKETTVAAVTQDTLLLVSEKRKGDRRELELRQENLENVERLARSKAEVAALIAEIRYFKETTVSAAMQDTFLLISHSLDHVERLARGQAKVAAVVAELKESLIEMEQIRNELQDSTSRQQDLAQRATSSELEKVALEATMSIKISELEGRLDTERAEREKERRALSVKHSNTVVINQTNHTVEIEKGELERISLQQQEQLKQNSKLIEALKRQVEEAEIKIKVLENPSSALSPPISREHQPPLSEHQPPLTAVESPLNLAPQGIAENVFLAGKLSSAEMEKADLKCLVEKSEHLLKIERSERARDTEEKAEMARKISELEGRLKEAVESLQNYKNEQPQKEGYLHRAAATEKQLEKDGSEREREKEEVEGLLKVAEMEKAELVERVSKMEDLFQKTKEDLKISRSEREKERKGLILEREKGKIELGEKLEDLKKQSEELELMAAQYDKMLRKAEEVPIEVLVDKLARSKAEAAALVTELLDLQTTTLAAVTQDTRALISEKIVRDLALAVERSERKQERDALEITTDALKKTTDALTKERAERVKERERVMAEREKEMRELAEKRAKLKKQSEEVDVMAAQYGEMLDKAAEEIDLSRASNMKQKAVSSANPNAAAADPNAAAGGFKLFHFPVNNRGQHTAEKEGENKIQDIEEKLRREKEREEKMRGEKEQEDKIKKDFEDRLRRAKEWEEEKIRRETEMEEARIQMAKQQEDRVKKEHELKVRREKEVELKMQRDTEQAHKEQARAATRGGATAATEDMRMSTSSECWGSPETPSSPNPHSSAPGRSPRSVFSARLQNFRLRASGHKIAMGGVGMTLAGATLLSEGCCVVREIEEGGPLHKFGLVQVGDRLLRANGISCVGMSYHEIKTHVIGPVGTSVCLVFSRGNSGGDIEAKLERAAVAPEADLRQTSEADLRQTSEADLPQADLPLAQPEADKYRKSEMYPDSLTVEKERNNYRTEARWPSETLSSEKSLSPNPTRVSAAQLLQILESDDPLQVGPLAAAAAAVFSAGAPTSHSSSPSQSNSEREKAVVRDSERGSEWSATGRLGAEELAANSSPPKSPERGEVRGKFLEI